MTAADAPGAATAQPAGASATEGAASTPPMDRAAAYALLHQWTDWLHKVSWLNREVGYVYLDDHNLRYRSPGSMWAASKPQDATKALLLYRHTELPIHFELYALPADAGFLPSTASAAELILQGSKRTVSNAFVLSDRPAIVKGLKGRRLDLSYVMNGKPTTQSCWVLVHHGSLYSMSVLGDSVHHAAVLSQATQMFSGFELLDRSGGTPAPARVASSDYHSTKFPFEVALKGSQWFEDKSGEGLSRGAMFRAVHGPSQASLDVMPICLFGQHPHLAATARGFLSLFPALPNGLRSPENRKPVTVGALQGFELNTAANQRRWRMRIVQGHGYAYLVVVSVADGSPRPEKLLGDAMDRVRFLDKTMPPDVGRATFRQQRIYSAMMNQIGLDYYDARQQDTAVPYFLRALEIQPENSVALSNAIEAYVSA
ncbi:MAG TPA: hypothetical protein VIK18_12990, partial [Pirellulales bacterium]